jgi:hypothetical protein
MAGFGEDLDRFQQKIKGIVHRAEKLDGRSVPVPEMLTDDFMARHSDFKTAQEMFDSCGIEMKSDEAVALVLKTPEWNGFVASRTRFASWDAMVVAAGEEWALKQLKVE